MVQVKNELIICWFGRLKKQGILSNESKWWEKIVLTFHWLLQVRSSVASSWLGRFDAGFCNMWVCKFQTCAQTCAWSFKYLIDSLCIAFCRLCWDKKNHPFWFTLEHHALLYFIESAPGTTSSSFWYKLVPFVFCQKILTIHTFWFFLR